MSVSWKEQNEEKSHSHNHRCIPISKNLQWSKILFTCSGDTWQKLDILCLTDWSMGFSERHTIKSGDKPNPRSSLTLACVGLVLCSPVEDGWGTRDTWTTHMFSLCKEVRWTLLLEFTVVWEFLIHEWVSRGPNPPILLVQVCYAQAAIFEVAGFSVIVYCATSFFGVLFIK